MVFDVKTTPHKTIQPLIFRNRYGPSNYAVSAVIRKVTYKKEVAIELTLRLFTSYQSSKPCSSTHSTKFSTPLVRCNNLVFTFQMCIYILRQTGRWSYLTTGNWTLFIRVRVLLALRPKNEFLIKRSVEI